MKETELAAPIVEWLKSDGWDVYQEVEGRAGRCDIYAVRGPIAWAIETKTTFGLRVIEQAYGWIGAANLVSIAVPKCSSVFGLTLCTHFGIGTIEVSDDTRHGHYEYRGERRANGEQCASYIHTEPVRQLTIIERSKPRLWRRCVRPTLYDSQRDFAPAGNNYGRYVTAASETKSQLVRLTIDEPGIALNDALRRISHHYASHASARSTIMKYIEWGEIPELRIEREGRVVRLFPSTT